MSILKDVFSAIEKMQTKLGKTQEDLQSIAQQMYSAYNDLPGDIDPAEDMLIFSIREHYRYMLTEKQRLQSNLDFARDLARRGKHTSSLWYTKDLCLNPLRLICVCEVLRRQGKKFKKYYPTQK